MGSHAVEALLATGHEPVCLARATSDVAHLSRLGVEVRTGSLEEPATLDALLSEADAVVHLAALVKTLSEDEMHRANAEGTRRLAEAAVRAPAVRSFVLVSSLAAKGPSASPASPRAATDPDPVSAYGRSKRAAELAALSVADSLAVRILRPPVVYGPRDRALLGLFRSVRRGLFPLAGGAGATLSTLYVEDAARAVVAALAANGRAPLLAEPADGPPHPWEEFRDAAAASLGVARVRSLRVPGWLVGAAGALASGWGLVTRRATPFNADKAREVRHPHWVADAASVRGLGWSPQVGLADGVRRTAEWYRREGWL